MATKAAVEEGIVPGGGVALLRAAQSLTGLDVVGDEQIGVDIIVSASEAPLRWTATNAGHEGSVVVQRIKAMKQDEGFNAQTDLYEDLVQAGVIDPAKVVRSKWAALVFVDRSLTLRRPSPPRSRSINVYIRIVLERSASLRTEDD